MKHSLILIMLLFLFFISNSFAQSSHPFPNKNGEWVVRKMGPGGTKEHKIFVEKDTIINNKSYSILKAEHYARAAVRCDSTKVYAVNINDWPDLVNWPFDSTEYVLYDYGLKVGDHFTMINYHERYWAPIDTVDFEITTIDYIDVKGELRKRIELRGGMNEQYWIEGVGSTRSPLYPAFMTEFEESFQLSCYRESGKNIFGDGCGPNFVNRLQKPIESSFNSEQKLLLLNAEGHLPITVTIFNSKGSLVCTYTESPQGQIDLSFLGKGIFIVALQRGTNAFSQKISINK